MENNKDMSAYRLEKAELCLRSAKIMIEQEDYFTAANRSYYCIFHCMRSVLALENIDFKKHSSIISYFREKYIKTKIFANDLSDIIGNLFRERNKSDYDDFYVINKKEAIEQVENAEYFMSQIKIYLDNQDN